MVGDHHSVNRLLGIWFNSDLWALGQLLVLHGLLKPRGLLPKETLPCWEVCSLEQSVFQNTFHPTHSLDHVSSVIVQVPEFPVMSLMCPPEGVLLQYLIHLELCPHSTALVISECVSVFLEESVDPPEDALVPAVLQVL